MGSLNFPNLDSLIAQFEGYYNESPDTPAFANNNPGNIGYGPFAVSQGATGSNNGFAVFPDAGTGFAATDALVSNYASQGANLQQLIEGVPGGSQGWAPANAPGNSQQSSDNYVSFLGQQLGVNPSTPLSSLSGSSPSDSSTAQPSNSWWNNLEQGFLNNLFPGVPLGSAQAANINPLNPATWPWSRVVVVVVVLMLIGGGILLFKPAQEFIAESSKTATEIAV